MIVGSESTKKSYWKILFILTLYVLSFAISIPVFPKLIRVVCSNDESKAGFYYGLSLFTRYIIEFVSAPITGAIADVRGRKALLIFAFITLIIEFLLLAFLPYLIVFFLSRMISGIGDCGISIVYTIVSDIAFFNGDIIHEKYGQMGAVFGLSFLVSFTNLSSYPALQLYNLNHS